MKEKVKSNFKNAIIFLSYTSLFISFFIANIYQVFLAQNLAKGRPTICQDCQLIPRYYPINFNETCHENYNYKEFRPMNKNWDIIIAKTFCAHKSYINSHFEEDFLNKFETNFKVSYKLSGAQIWIWTPSNNYIRDNYYLLIFNILLLSLSFAFFIFTWLGSFEWGWTLKKSLFCYYACQFLICVIVPKIIYTFNNWNQNDSFYFLNTSKSWEELYSSEQNSVFLNFVYNFVISYFLYLYT